MVHSIFARFHGVHCVLAPYTLVESLTNNEQNIHLYRRRPSGKPHSPRPRRPPVKVLERPTRHDLGTRRSCWSVTHRAAVGDLWPISGNERCEFLIHHRDGIGGGEWEHKVVYCC